jgi:hypothetical protein
VCIGEPEPPACPVCGRPPDAIEVVEIVVHNRAEAQAALALRAEV